MRDSSSEPKTPKIMRSAPGSFRTENTHFSVKVSGPWSTVGRGDRGSRDPDSSPMLRLSPFTFETAPACSSPHTYIDCVLRDIARPFAGSRASCDGTWSLGKYDIEDCRRGFAGLNARAEGGGVERPRPVDVGDTAEEGKLLSSSCNGRGADVGEATIGDATGLLITRRGIVIVTA